MRPLKLWAEGSGSGAFTGLKRGSKGPGRNKELYWKVKAFTYLNSTVINSFNSLISLIKILSVRYSTLILVSRRSKRELSSESSSFALKAVYSGAIKAIFSKALGAVAAGAGALEAAAVAVYAGALEAATVAVCAGALKAAAAAVATATVARVTRSCLGLLRPSGVLIVPNLRFSH